MTFSCHNRSGVSLSSWSFARCSMPRSGKKSILYREWHWQEWRTHGTGTFSHHPFQMVHVQYIFKHLKKKILFGCSQYMYCKCMFLDGDSIFMNYRKCFVLSSLLDCKFEAEWRHFSFNRIVIRNYIWKGWYMKRIATCNWYLLLVFTCMETQSMVL